MLFKLIPKKIFYIFHKFLIDYEQCAFLATQFPNYSGNENITFVSGDLNRLTLRKKGKENVYESY